MINAVSSFLFCIDDGLLLSLSIQKVMPGAMSLVPLSPPNVSVAALNLLRRAIFSGTLVTPLAGFNKFRCCGSVLHISQVDGRSAKYHSTWQVFDSFWCNWMRYVMPLHLSPSHPQGWHWQRKDFLRKTEELAVWKLPKHEPLKTSQHTRTARAKFRISQAGWKHRGP